MKKMIEKALKEMMKDSIVLTILPREQYDELNAHLLKILVNNKGLNGTYVTINKTYNNMLKVLKSNKIDNSKLHFIDCVSEVEDAKSNCNFIGTPQSLTNIGIALDPFYKNEKHSFIFFDSLDALSSYHTPDLIVRFARSLIGRVRENGKIGVMMGIHEDTDKKIIDRIASVCDKVIKPF